MHITCGALYAKRFDADGQGRDARPCGQRQRCVEGRKCKGNDNAGNVEGACRHRTAEPGKVGSVETGRNPGSKCAVGTGGIAEIDGRRGDIVTGRDLATYVLVNGYDNAPLVVYIDGKAVRVYDVCFEIGNGELVVMPDRSGHDEN